MVGLRNLFGDVKNKRTDTRGIPKPHVPQTANVYKHSGSRVSGKSVVLHCKFISILILDKILL